MTLWRIVEVGGGLLLGARSDLKTKVRFGAVGGVSTIVGVCTIWILEFTGAGHLSANAGGYCIGLTLSFLLNRNWTFVREGSLVRSAVQFLLVFVIAYSANIAAVLLFTRGFGVNAYLAQVSGMPIYTILFYLGSRHFAFRPSDTAPHYVAEG